MGRLVHVFRSAIRLLSQNWNIGARYFLVITFQRNGFHVLEKDIPGCGKMLGEDLHLKGREKKIMMARFLK